MNFRTVWDDCRGKDILLWLHIKDLSLFGLQQLYHFKKTSLIFYSEG